MTKITVLNDGFLIDNKILFGSSEENRQYINLTKVAGEDMRYQKLEHTLVDYPGEYDIGDITIQAFLGNNKMLNYLIIYGNKKMAILQSPDVLESVSEFAVTQEWFYTEDSILAKLEQLEVEGKKIKLEEFIVNVEDKETEEVKTNEIEAEESEEEVE